LVTNTVFDSEQVLFASDNQHNPTDGGSCQHRLIDVVLYNNGTFVVERDHKSRSFLARAEHALIVGNDGSGKIACFLATQTLPVQSFTRVILQIEILPCSAD
jgi:hypothetical protein